MVATVALDKVGIILALEVSRLARGNRNWYRLLDVSKTTWQNEHGGSKRQSVVRDEVQLARWQYDVVDPDNRLVARELERRFERCDELERTESEAEDHLKTLPEGLMQAKSNN